MADKTQPVSRSTTKRKSILSDLGIQPNALANKSTDPKPTARKAPPAAIKTDRTTTTPSSPSPRRPSTVPTSPSVNRVVRPSKTPLTKPATPSKTTAAASPTRRRSVVPSSTTSSSRPLSSPLARVAPTTSHTKRTSLAESTIKEKVSEELLEQKENEIERLKKENEKQVASLQQEIEILKKQIESSPSSVTENATNKDQQVVDQLKEAHQQEINKLSESQEKRLESELIKLRDEYEKKLEAKDKEIVEQISYVKAENDRLKNELETKQNEINQDKAEIINYKTHIASLEEQIMNLENSTTSSHVRKLETDLTNATSALEQHKHQSQLQIEGLERRQREEMRQLQSGTDDSAMAWLEKTKAAQQEVNVLQDMLEKQQKEHNDRIQSLEQAYEKQISELKQVCHQKELEIEERSGEIENLLDRVETLQNSLEAATTRLEHTTRLTPTTSLSTSETSGNEMYIKRLEAKQKELDDLKSRLVEIKETHESQLNRLGQEKANDIQELRKTIARLEQQAGNKNGMRNVDEERLIRVAEQHRKEISVMHDQYQSAIDTKNKELEDYAYRLKALVASKQKEIEGYEIKLKELEKTKKAHRDENEQLIK
ncbi:hypothetical protein G6F22_004591 [Rhizopus arrhizus]|nr:hypothetical protein G6F23_006283 [Rhizopus arrhizus]KAG0797952.1 hypothetical protein G6F22_004591 [Rhizopus arrhizus]KAG0845842.1 hypothetical protein G6F18_000596 [Rhizopus arrhizus]KAG0961670.1 hypothetical protein G6F31_009425 [Rhizopus arrhizus]